MWGECGVRKKLALAAVLVGILLIGGVPGFILGRVGRYQVVAPQVVAYQPSIRCEGVVCPGEGYDLVSAGLYLVEERYVSLGDPVAEGEVLAVLAPAGGEAVLYLQTQGSGLGVPEGQSSLESLMQSYGSLSGQAEMMQLEQFRVGEETAAGGRVEVLSPVTGIVTREVPEPGSVVKPGAVVASVEGRESFFALLTVGEKDATKLAVGDRVLLTGEGVGQAACDGAITKVYPGTRKELNGAVTQNVVDVEASIHPGGREIRPGFSVKAKIFTDIERPMMVVPYEAVRQDQDDLEYVMVAGEYRLEKRPVTTGQATAEGVEILDGLLPDELVTVLPENQEQGERYLLEYREGE